MIAVAFVATAVVGALLRWRMSRWNRVVPWGTLVVNVTAAFAAGLITGSSANVVLIVGVAGLGSMSTFSTVMAEAVDMRDRASTRVAIAYLGTTLTLGIGAAVLGLALAESL